MQILKKNPWLVYLICALLVFTPTYYVWVHFPEIKSSDPERASGQVLGLAFLAAIPFIGVCIGILLERNGR
jgi:hypothetical protein